MAFSDKDLKLDEWADEDIFDIVAKLEKAFSLKFDKNAFYNVKTFGDLCNVFEHHITGDHIDDCTTQQAFYRVRKAIRVTQNVDDDKIRPGTLLSELFPEHNRRMNVKEFKSRMGIKIDVMTYTDWIGWTLTIGLLMSLLSFFWSGIIGLTSLALVLFAFHIAHKLGTKLSLQTVGELVKKISREHYTEVRRKKNTINRKEVSNIIIDAFSNDLLIDKADLTRESKFSWAIEKAK